MSAAEPVTPEITVRKIDFEFPQDMELVFIKDDPYWSYIFLGAWMMLPYLEPYLMRSVRQAMNKVEDPVLKEEMRRFIAQEGNHFKAHGRANAVIRSRHPGFEKMLELEKALQAEFQDFSSNKSLRFNLAYAEGFEAMTSATAWTQFNEDLFDQMHSPIRELMEWHIMEELEHRTVAFDAYDKVYGGYFYRLFYGLWAQSHYIRWGLRFTKVMIEADTETIAKYADRKKAATKARNRFLWKTLPKVLKIYLPWYTPHKTKLPKNFEAARLKYSDVAVTAS